jgi:hypothetical protein
MKRAIQVYFVFGLLFIALYAAGEIAGYEPAGAAVERIDPTVRHSPGSSGGGGGGSSFWHTGFHGGK